MAKRYDMMSPRKARNDKTYWTRIGSAWESEKGIQLVFDALPLPDAEGRVVANLFEPREREDQTRTRQTSQRRDDYADDVPF